MEIQEVRKGEDRYPERFFGLAGMPECLYYIGRLPKERDAAPCVAIVGARLCDRYGHLQAYAFGKALAEAGAQVISGMAIGIDTWALQGALDGGGAAFAVLGSGVDVCYPRSNRELYERLAIAGGILSEFEPGCEAAGWHFPVRNRIISALSDLVLVVQARRRSGSLITADYALEQGRSVYAVPGRVGDPLAEGCNHLIEQGAGIACSAESLYTELKIAPAAKAGKGADLTGGDPDGSASGGNEGPADPGERRILSALTSEPAPLEAVSQRAGLPVSRTAELLTKLVLRGDAVEAAPHYYAV